MLRAYKHYIKPNKYQKEYLTKTFGCVRFVYNWGLAKKIELYQKKNKQISCFDLTKELTQLKKQKEYEWLKEVDSQSLQQSLRHLDNAFTRFFKKKNQFPKFKSKKDNYQSFSLTQNIFINNSFIKIPKVRKTIKAYNIKEFEGKIKTCTISKTPDGKYYISILVDDGKELPQKAEIKQETAVGIDLGIKHFATLSTGEKIENPKHTKSKEKKLAKHQRRLARKQNGSKRKNRQRIRVAKIYKEISNARNDFLHKLSKSLINRFDSIAVENLNVNGMLKNHRLAKAIGDCSWGTFNNMLKYKSDWYGKNYIQIGRFDPSSKICNNCSYINTDLILKDRKWKCPKCGIEHDRDINASYNILKFGLQKYNLITPAVSGSEDMDLLALAGSMKCQVNNLIN